MELMQEADRVVREFLPAMLKAAGQTDIADDFRNSNPIRTKRAVIVTAMRLHKLAESNTFDPVWAVIIEDTLFWCEAAIWAAADQDIKEFKNHLRRAAACMESGLPLVKFLH